MHYLFGLGNPGGEYEHTRHNAGRMLLAAYADRAGIVRASDRLANAAVGMGEAAGRPITIVLPETYMNRSGESARYFVEKHDAHPENFIVLHDDVDLPLGTLRVSVDRGDGGHNGIKSMIEGVGSKAFARIRVGIAPTSFLTGKVKRPHAGGPLERFVLGAFSRRERAVIEGLLPQVAETIEAIVGDGAAKAMRNVNSEDR